MAAKWKAMGPEECQAGLGEDWKEDVLRVQARTLGEHTFFRPTPRARRWLYCLPDLTPVVSHRAD